MTTKIVALVLAAVVAIAYAVALRLYEVPLIPVIAICILAGKGAHSFLLRVIEP